MFELPPPRKVRYVSQQKVFPRKRHVCLHHLFLCCFFLQTTKTAVTPSTRWGIPYKKKCKVEKLHRVVCGFSLASLCGWNHPIICIDVCIPGTQMTSIFEGQPSKTRPFPIKTRVIYGFQVYVYWDSYSYIYERFVIHIFGNRSFKFENVLSSLLGIFSSMVVMCKTDWIVSHNKLHMIENFELKRLSDSSIVCVCVIVSCSQRRAPFPSKQGDPPLGSLLVVLMERSPREQSWKE